MLRSGLIDYRMVSLILTRTENVDDALIGVLDEALAAQVHKWMKLSKPKLRDRIDMWVAQHDPAAVRIAPEVDEHRYADVEPGRVGMAFFSAHLRATDGAALDKRLEALAATVCEHDPRTINQRRADACGAVGRGEAALVCQCGRADCPAAAERRAAASAVIHVLAEQATLDGASDKPGYLAGFGVLPAQCVRDLADNATVTPVTVPDADAEARYRPSAAVGLNTDSRGVQIAWSENSNADDWSKNLIRARCEGRYATSVFQPLGVVQSDLTA